jgi:hypothetical protein
MIVSGELEQWRCLLPQTLEIDDLVVRGASLPALPDNTNPFEGQSADGGVMVFAFGALAGVVSASPERVLDGLGGKFMEGLAKELGTKVSPSDAELFTAPLDDGSDAGEGDQFIGRLPATRSEPRAAVRRAAWTGPAPGKEANNW